MSTAGVGGLLVISMIAVAAPVLASRVQRARVPDVVIEIVAGIVVGPSVLGWMKIDQPVGLVAVIMSSSHHRQSPTAAGQAGGEPYIYALPHLARTLASAAYAALSRAR